MTEAMDYCHGVSVLSTVQYGWMYRITSMKLKPLPSSSSRAWDQLVYS